MIKWVLAWFSEISTVPTRPVMVFIPCSEKGTRDGVGTLLRYVQSSFSRARMLLVPSRTDTFEHAGHAEGFDRAPRRLLLFAHPNDRHNGFAVNEADGSGVIHADWWRWRRSHFDLIIAHVCHGAAVLEQDPFQAVFPRWVSYRGALPIFLGSRTAVRRWTKLVRAFSTAASKSRTAAAAKLRLAAVYAEAMAEVEDTWDPEGGDLLTLGYLQKCSELLACSESDD
jgi:hypothetical protein